jgi:type II secretory pathway component PulL
VSAEGQLIYINFFHQSNSIQLLVSLVIDSSHTRFAAWRWAGFSAQKLIRRTELSATSKLSSGDETPPIANVLLVAALLSVR